VPTFEQTQQKWEDPAPYGEATNQPAMQNQQQNALKEPSLGDDLRKGTLVEYALLRLVPTEFLGDTLSYP
jgi:hypothetical protein